MIWSIDPIVSQMCINVIMLHQPILLRIWTHVQLLWSRYFWCVRSQFTPLKRWATGQACSSSMTLSWSSGRSNWPGTETPTISNHLQLQIETVLLPVWWPCRSLKGFWCSWTHLRGVFNFPDLPWSSTPKRETKARPSPKTTEGAKPHGANARGGGFSVCTRWLWFSDMYVNEL